MNVSMQDGFNLGWKLAAVVRGQCPPALLATYSAERQAVAAELIAFDREFAAMFGTVAKDAAGEGAGAQAASFQSYFVRQGRYTAGTETKYHPSMIVGPATHQHLAAGLPIGMRFHSAPVIRLADAKPLQLGATVKADGRWRLFVFAGTDLATFETLCAYLETGRTSPVRHTTPAGADIDSVIDVRAILPHAHQDVAFSDMPALLRPAKGRYGLCDYEKLFCPDLKSGQDIYTLRGIDRAGCIVAVRPDQYVAHVLPMTAHDELTAFFEAIFLDRQDRQAEAARAAAAPAA
jgi:phenol 2-monooxygenase